MQNAKVVGVEELNGCFDRSAISSLVRGAIIAHSRGQTVSPPMGELHFNAHHGECHLRCGYMLGGARFVVKVVTGFYENPKVGLPVNSGALMVFSATTGLFESVLLDEGWLTVWRTAAAGSLATVALARKDTKVIAIIGAGQQAEQQTFWHAAAFPDAEFVIGARDPEKAIALSKQLQQHGVRVRAEASIQAAVRAADAIITTTPATKALFQSEDVRPGTHITAVGADSAGKQELDPLLVARAKVIATDDHTQCIERGEFGVAVRQGFVKEDCDTSLGDILSSESEFRTGSDDITIADLTGLVSEDIAMASFFIDQLKTSSATSQ
jgi:ornithine cyclodeaminase